jgi:hypothetical protein
MLRNEAEGNGTDRQDIHRDSETEDEKAEKAECVGILATDEA